jgi:hypothetical protein
LWENSGKILRKDGRRKRQKGGWELKNAGKIAGNSKMFQDDMTMIPSRPFKDEEYISREY